MKPTPTRALVLSAVILAVGSVLRGGPPDDAVDALIAAARLPEHVRLTAVGVTRAGTLIPALLTDDDVDPRTRKARILLVGGLDGSTESVRSALEVFVWFHTSAEAATDRERLAVSLVPVVNPDDWFGRRSGSDRRHRDLSRGWPPKGPFYGDERRPEIAYLWRWIGMHAPDLVVEVIGKDVGGKEAESTADDAFVAALSRGRPAGVGAVPAIRVPADSPSEMTGRLIERSRELRASPARTELRRRRERSPVETATILARHYGRGLGNVAYIPALALIGRVRLGELVDDESHLADVREIVAPYVEGRATFGKSIGGAAVAGHLVFTELAKRRPDERLKAVVERVVEAAYDGSPGATPFRPHNQMSDAVFMGGPLLAQYAKLTGESTYFDLCIRHVEFMTAMNVREDGLHRHSPLDETAWGRGNGFPALGLALILEDFPQDHPQRPYLLKAYREHMAALKNHQDVTGMWHQVIDHPESYRELSCTSMITFAMLRGLRHGWLDAEEYEPVVRRAWPAINQRIADDGTLVDVCTGTGKQKSLRVYLDRKAILGKDARGGAMTLLVATEMAAWEKAGRAP